MALGSYGLWTICTLLFCNDKGEQVVIQLGQICSVVIWYTNVVEKLSTVQCTVPLVEQIHATCLMFRRPITLG